MSTTRRTTLQPILDVPEPSDDRTYAEDQPPQRRRDYKTVLALAFVVVLLVLVATAQGAYGVSGWAPLALLALGALIGGLLARGGLAIRSRPVVLAIASIWLLAGWSLLSMVWAQSSGNAFAAGDRMVFYAAIATLPFVLAFSRRTLVVAGWAVTVGLGAVAVYVLVRLLVHGEPLYLAGRLNAPINYRNATALLFALPAWPGVIAAAGKDYRWWVRAGALALTMLCLGLVWLTQSRGIVLGLAVGAVPVFVLGPDRVRRAWIAMFAVGAVALASHWLLRPFHAFDGGAGVVGPHAITVAAEGLVAVTVAGFVVGLLIALVDKALRPGSAPARVVQWTARIALGGAILAAVVAAAVAIGNPVTYANQKWDQFHSLQTQDPTSTRLGSVGGQRYDLWRVAWREFESAPVLGVGADNYSFDYYRERATNRNLIDPHSIVFALLSENGAVGVVLFVLFLGGLFGAMASGWRALPPASRRHAMAPAAAGAVMLGQSMVDWIWLIPGLTAIGIFALAVAAAQVGAARNSVADSEPARPSAGLASRRIARLSGRVAAIGALLVATVAVLALFLSNAYIERARSVVYNPPAELSAARTAALFDPWSVTPHYLESSAYETMGERPKAYAQLQDALSLEPLNSATLGVLGDFEVRGGHVARARAFYRRALALDPLDVGLQQLTRIGEPPPKSG